MRSPVISKHPSDGNVESVYDPLHVGIEGGGFTGGVGGSKGVDGAFGGH